MKTIYWYFILSSILVINLSNATGPANNGNGGRTGAPGEGTCANCHNGGSFSPVLTIKLFNAGTTNPITNYTPGTTYDLQVQVSSLSGAPKFGFQLTALDMNNTMAGSFNTPGSLTQIIINGARTYMEQSAKSSTGIFTAKWIAPALNTGSVTFYASGNCVNSSSSISGDNSISGSLTIPESCTPPTGLAATNITNTSSTLSWQAVGSANSYTAHYKPANATTWTTLLSNSPLLTKSITGLTANTLYDYRVRANCTGGNTSYTMAQFTTTNNTCGNVTNLTNTSINNGNHIISWNSVPGALTYKVQYKLPSATSWSNSTSNTALTTDTISGLSANTTYDVRVRANCTGVNGAYTQSQFTTSNYTCGNVTAVTILPNITTASISWAPVSGVLNYKFQYKKSTSTVWLSKPLSPINSVLLTNLSSGTLYNYRVRAICLNKYGNFTYGQFITDPSQLLKGQEQLPLEIDEVVFKDKDDETEIDSLTVSDVKIIREKQEFKISWTAQTNSLIHAYNVLRSYDGQNFVPIAQVPVIPRNSVMSNYIFVDYEAHDGLNYYQIEEQTIVGDKILIPLILFGDKSSNKEQVRLYPNPVNDFLTIVFEGHKLDRVEIFDIQGRLIKSIRSKDFNNLDNYHLDLSMLKSGVYAVRIIDSTNTSTVFKVSKN